MNKINANIRTLNLDEKHLKLIKEDLEKNASLSFYKQLDLRAYKIITIR